MGSSTRRVGGLESSDRIRELTESNRCVRVGDPNAKSAASVAGEHNHRPRTQSGVEAAAALGAVRVASTTTGYKLSPLSDWDGRRGHWN
jgi:hypothetical protein